MRVAFVPFPATPTARIELVIRAGVSDESASEPGIAPIVAQFLSEGTRSRSADQIAQLVSDLGALGAAISVNTDSRETVLGVDVLPDAAPAMIELLADMVRHPAFETAALERLKANAVRRLQLQRTQADWLAASRANSLLFPDNPADRVPTEEQLRSIDVAAISDFYKTSYVPSRARLYVAGTFDEARVERAAAAAFEGWNAASSASFTLPPSANARVINPGDRPVIYLIDRPGATQARVQVSFPVVDMAHPDQAVLNEMNMLMGSTQTARLIANIRERHGYSYNISSRLVRRPGSTQWVAAADITNNVVGPAIQEMLSEIARLRREPPAAEELRSFQSFMAGILVQESSTAQGILENLRWMDLYGVSTSYFGTFIQNLYKIEPRDIRAVAERYLRPDRMAIVVVGDRKVLLPQLEAIARVQSAVDARAQADKLDEYIEAEMLKQHIPGLSLGVVQGGKVVKIKAYGLANIELNAPATPNTIYQLQSITKSFVACGIMLLVEDGKLGLDDKITKYLSGLPEAWSGVTVRHLLTHTSGIPNFVGDQGSGAAIIAFSQKVSSSEEIIGWATARPLKFAPGEGWHYSSTGYQLLGMIIEKVSGKPWGQFLHDRIFARLGMTSTRVYSFYDIIPNRASGYNHFGDVPVNGVWMTSAIMESPAGGLLSTVEDMAKWEIALETGTILKPSTLAQMEVPIKLKNDSIVKMNDGTRFGLGWVLPAYPGHHVVAHSGDHITGFTANFSRFIDDKVAVIVLTNLMPLDIGTITRRVAGFYVPALLPANTGGP